MANSHMQYFPTTLKYPIAADNRGKSKHLTESHEHRSGNHQQFSIAERAHRLARDHEEAHIAKLSVFMTICESLDEACKRFTTDPERAMVQALHDSYLEYWEQALAGIPADTGKGLEDPSPHPVPDQGRRFGPSSTTKIPNRGALADLETTSTFEQWLQWAPRGLIVRVGCIFPSSPLTYGFAIYEHGTPVLVGSSWLEPGEACDREDIEALNGLQAALHLRQSETQQIVVCLDVSMHGPYHPKSPSDSPQASFQRLCRLAIAHDVQIIGICACMSESQLAQSCSELYRPVEPFWTRRPRPRSTYSFGVGNEARAPKGMTVEAIDRDRGCTSPPI